MKTILVETGDGSHSLYVPRINEYYHSHHGAVTESLHVFINEGLNAQRINPLRILEIGFGTGLNAFLTFSVAQSQSRSVTYDSVDNYPLPEHLVKKINYPAIIPGSPEKIFLKLHSAEWNKEVLIASFFKLHKILADATVLSLSHQYDLVYFDAFGPEKQPEMWSAEMFSKIYNAMSNKGILTTYSASGEVRRTMKRIGFLVEKLPGPPGGKREMTRAIKKNL